MGEIADGLIDGTFDALTGEYLGEGLGFPRTTDKEHADSTGIFLLGETIRVKHYSNGGRRKGVKKYIKKLGKDPQKTIQKFYSEVFPDLTISNEKKCLHISTRYWPQFTKWLKT